MPLCERCVPYVPRGSSRSPGSLALYCSNEISGQVASVRMFFD